MVKSMTISSETVSLITAFKQYIMIKIPSFDIERYTRVSGMSTLSSFYSTLKSDAFIFTKSQVFLFAQNHHTMPSKEASMISVNNPSKITVHVSTFWKKW